MTNAGLSRQSHQQVGIKWQHHCCTFQSSPQSKLVTASKLLTDQMTKESGRNTKMLLKKACNGFVTNASSKCFVATLHAMFFVVIN